MGKVLQPAVRALLENPNLKLSDDLAQTEIDRCIALFDQIAEPVSKADAIALVELLDRSDDEMFEANWHLLHCIESSSAWPVWEVLERCHGEWSRLLLTRLLNGGYVPPPGVQK